MKQKAEYSQLVFSAALSVVGYEDGVRCLPVAIRANGIFVVQQELLRACCERYIVNAAYVNVEGMLHLLSPQHLAHYYDVGVNDVMHAVASLREAEKAFTQVDKKETIN